MTSILAMFKAMLSSLRDLLPIIIVISFFFSWWYCNSLYLTGGQFCLACYWWS